MLLLFENNLIKIYVEDINVYLEVHDFGVNLKEFTEIIKLYPRVKVTNFGLLNKAVQEANGEPVIIGVYRCKIELEISRDEMIAFIKINVLQKDVELYKKEIIREIVETLNNNEINTGLKKEIFSDKLIVNRKLIVAEGIPAIPGEDAVIKYFESLEKKPEIRQDGSVNHYELNLIDKVNKDDWLGEKIPLTEGKPGLSVTGKEIIPKAGREKLLKYDHETVECIQQGHKEILKAKVDGAVRFKDGKIGIDNHLIIKGEVGYSTGNVDFDGYVTVEGTVKDGFSITATQDITINGDMGVGAIDKIESKRGSVFVKGGISGKGIGKIIAHKDIFVKFANEAIIEARGSINIGYYAIDSILNAKKIHVNPQSGRVIGGEINADHQIIAGTVGNKYEKKTVVNVKGFERGDIKQQLDNILIHYKELINEADGIRRQLDIFETHLSRLDEKAQYTYKRMTIQYESIVDQSIAFNDKVKELQEVLKTKGEGEVHIHNSMYPKTFMEIKSLQKRVMEQTTGSFYVKNNTLHFDE